MPHYDPAPPDLGPPPVDDKRTIWSWCFYDWANSAFTTLIVTFVYATYFTRSFAPTEDAGTALWSRGIAISSLLIALLSPVLGAMADRGGNRRRHLITSTLICVAATATLAFVTPDGPNAALFALTLFIVGNVAFEVGMVFYNSFLPIIASSDRIGRVSGNGWGLGYAGGLVCLILALVLFVGLGDTEGMLGLSTENNFNVRATNLLVAGWFLLFSIPMFLWVRDPATPTGSVSVREAVAGLGQTFRQLRKYREIVRFLIARLIYNDGLVTIFAFGGIYAAGTFGFEFGDVIVFGIALNVAAGLGAWAFGFFDDKVGGKATILVSLVALLVAATIAVVAPNRTWFWIAGIMVGIFAGPNQSASRSLMARFVPDKHQSEFFGFFAFSGKATVFLGPLLLGILTDAFGQRAGVSVVLLFFVVGGLLMLAVNEKAGVEAGR